MKRILPFFLLAAGMSSAQDTTYNRVYSHAGEDLRIKKIVRSPQKGIMAAGTYKLANGLILSLDSNGVEQFSRQLRFIGDDDGYFSFESLLSTSDGNFLASGGAANTNDGVFDGWCLKFDALGDTLWSRGITNPFDEPYEIRAALETYTNNYAVAGSGVSGGTGFITILDPQGAISWSRRFAVADGILVNGLVEAADHSFYITGQMGFENTTGGFILHLSETGTLLWAKQYDNYSFGETIADAEGNLLNYSFNPMGMVKTGPAGDVVWAKSFPGDYFDYYRSDLKLISINDTTYAALQGHFYQSDLILFNNDGEAQESHSLLLNTCDMFRTDDKGLVVAGNGPMLGLKSDINRSKAGIAKTDSLYSSGSFCISGPYIPSLQDITIIVSDLTVDVTSNTLVVRHVPFAMDELPVNSQSGCMDALGGLNEKPLRALTVYPNVSNGRFSFHNDQQDSFELIITDALGKEVHHTGSTGETTTVDLTGFGSGIYFYKALFENEGVAAGKVVISK